MDAVVVVLREELEEARQRGADFGDAWAPALEHALALAPRGPQRATWSVALGSTVAAWRRCYVGVAPSHGELTAARLRDVELGVDD
jgi:hypothetical protein